jgi:hypothetical protein
LAPLRALDLAREKEEAMTMRSAQFATRQPAGRRAAALALGAVILLLLVTPAAVSLSNGDGAICFADAACPLSAVNPCVRKPTFAVVGRCAIAIR